jgi:hypothetical protein
MTNLIARQFCYRYLDFATFDKINNSLFFDGTFLPQTKKMIFSLTISVFFNILSAIELSGREV